jgi:hypothetical protein
MRKVRESSMVLAFEYRARVFRFIRALAFAFMLIAVITPRPTSAEDIAVILDQAKLVKVPEKVATIVVGNPLIADATVQAGGLLIVTGKGYGRTNIVALDRSGSVMMEKIVEVQEPRVNVVYVYRGVERASYSCTPYCDPRITLGDSVAFFDAVIAQTATRNGLAQGYAMQAK